MACLIFLLDTTALDSYQESRITLAEGYFGLFSAKFHKLGAWSLKSAGLVRRQTPTLIFSTFQEPRLTLTYLVPTLRDSVSKKEHQ